MSTDIYLKQEFEQFLFQEKFEFKWIEVKELGEPFIQCKNVFFHLNELKNGAGKKNAVLADYFERQKLTLIQIWPDQWLLQKELLQSRIRVLLGKAKKIYARETKAIRISNPQLVEFLEKNHLSVPLKGKIKYGLIKDEELVSVISLSHPRTFDRSDHQIKSYEILRMCHIQDHIVTGGLSKLMKHFIEEHQADHVMTYIDRDWGTGEGFEKIGFKKCGKIGSRIFLINKSNFLRKLISDSNPDSNIKDGIRIYNSGSLKMEFYTKK